MRVFCLIFLLAFSRTIIAQNNCLLAKQQLQKKAGGMLVSDVLKMNKYDVHFYKLDLAVENNSVIISGNAAMHARVISPIKSITLQLHTAMQIDSIMLNDSISTYSRLNDVLTVDAKDTLQANSFFRLVVFYHGTAPNVGAGAINNGLNNNLAHTVTWSLSEPLSAYEWWPCKQVLTDKADSSEVFITTDTANKAGSNGLLKKTTNLANGKVRYEWKSNYPIAYYLISLAVCPYEEYREYAHPAGVDSILIQNYIYKDADPDVKQSLAYTPALIEAFSSKLGLYPFASEKYGHCQSETGGAMEHQTMTTIGYFNFDIVAHELGHQWFGDYVTCGSWSDIWLNEGFASYCEYIAIELLMPATQKQQWVASTQNTAKQASGSVYVTDTFTSKTIFDGASTYNKGASLVHMLRYEINNDSLFFLGLRNYLHAHRLGTALVSDFRKAMEQTTGKDFNTFFNQWYYGTGYPVFKGVWNELDKKILLNLRQTPSMGSTVFKTTIDIKFSYAGGGDTTIRVWIDSASKMMTFDLGGKSVTTIRVDPQNYILKDLISIAKNPLFNFIPGVNAEQPGVIIYPNPSIGQLNFMHANGCLAEVFDMKGARVVSMNIQNDNEYIDLGSLPNGVYAIRVSGAGGVTTVKFVKQ